MSVLCTCKYWSPNGQINKYCHFGNASVLRARFQTEGRKAQRIRMGKRAALAILRVPVLHLSASEIENPKTCATLTRISRSGGHYVTEQVYECKIDLFKVPARHN